MVKKNKSDKKEKGPKDQKPKVPYSQGSLQPALTKAARSMRTFLTNSLSASGLYAGQDGVIQILADDEPLTAGVIAARLGVKPPTMTRTLARMEAQGFIERIADESDGRQVRAGLTELGRRQLGAIGYATKATETFALSGLSDKECKQFVKILKKINANFEPPAEDDDGFGE